jgi:hypothetical protein
MVNASTGGAAFYTAGVNGTRYSTILTSASSVVIETNAAIPLTFNTNETERMRITSAGNVGIGTTAANTALTVSGIITSTNADYTGRYTSTPLTLTGGGPSGGGQTFTIGNSGMVGMLIVSVSINVCAAIYILSGTNQPTLVSQTTQDTRFSATSGALNTANVYVSGANLILQNNIQATREFYITFIGKTS